MAYQEVALRLVVFCERSGLREVELFIADTRQVELRQRVIQPMGGRDAELYFLPLGDIEVLVQPQIAVKVRGPVQIGEVESPLLSIGWHREAVRIEIGARGTLPRIAGHHWLQNLVGVGAEPG